MTIKIAINGYGRIGRQILRTIYENNHRNEVEIMAINSGSGPIETAAHLTRYDTVHGRFSGEVNVDGNYLVINGDRIHYSNIRDPKELPWKKLGIDIVHECTGKFRTKDTAEAHIKAGAKKVLISAPAKNVDNTIVYGVNHQTLRSTDLVVSNASCTTNCLAPLLKPLVDAVGLIKGFMLTIHAYTNDQVLLDRTHKDLRRARSACLSIIPTKTGATKSIGDIIPEIKGCLGGSAVRVPTANVSMVELIFESKRNTSVEEINDILKQASENQLKGILAYNKELLVSHDFNHHPASSIYDATLTKVSGNLVKVFAWYDNEWAFSNRMIDTTLAMMAV